MLKSRRPDPIDYLLIGHISQDLTPDGGYRIGGTVAYAALTARALGLRPGIVTSCAEDLDISPLDGIPIINLPAEYSTTFENIETPHGRVQKIHARAQLLDYQHIPETWMHTPLVHLAPIAQEVSPRLVRYFPDSFLVITPQGWLREWNASGKIHTGEWPEARFVLETAGAAIFSLEDMQEDESRIEELIHTCPVIVVTEGSAGARVYWHSDVRRFRAPQVQVVDTVGAGDIFAAAFFVRLEKTRDPWEAARFATYLAACSVTRSGLDSIPTPQEIEYTTIEVF
ncbi:MAG: ribokinase [Anaerolineae bacterium]|nr:MAG: ribokinase [Anaerolineae bacterium]